MPDFEKLEQEAQQEAQGHSQQVDDAITKGEQEADQRVGQDHDSQVQQAGAALERELGGQSEEGQQRPNQP